MQRQAAGAKNCRAADRAGTGAVASMVVHVCRLDSGPRKGLAERTRSILRFARRGRRFPGGPRIREIARL